jgi:protein arginine N-methyltransferase 5
MSKKQHDKQLSCGRDLGCVTDLLSALDKAGKCGFDFVSIPLVHPRYKRDFVKSNGTHGGNVTEPLTRNDMLLSSGDWMSMIVGKISPWIHLESHDQQVRENSLKVLREELVFSTHLNIPVVLLYLRSSNCVQLAQCLLSHCGTIKGSQGFWICVPLHDDISEDTWEWWNKFRNLCGNDRKISVVLEVGAKLPSESVRNRWLGESVRGLTIPTSTFVVNQRGFPVLTRAHQEFLRCFFKV